MNPKIIKIILLLITLSFPMFAQTEYVLADNPVYKFLERMESLHFIERYNSFEIPKTRGEVGNYLKQVIGHEGELDKADKDFLNDSDSNFAGFSFFNFSSLNLFISSFIFSVTSFGCTL